MILLLINAASRLLPVGPNRLPLSSERHTLSQMQTLSFIHMSSASTDLLTNLEDI